MNADDEIDLTVPVRLVWRRRTAVAIVTAVMGAGAYFWAARVPQKYEATAELRLSETLPTEGGLAPYKPVVDSRLTAERVVKDLGLDRPPHNIDPASFLGDGVRSEVLPGATAIAIKVRLSDADLAIRAANRFAELAAALVRDVIQRAAAGIDDSATARIGELRQRLTDADEAVDRFNRESQIEVLRADVSALSDQRARRLAFSAEIAGEQARLAEAEQELARQGPRGAANETLRATLEQQVAISRLRLVSLEKQRATLDTMLKQGASMFSQLQAREADLTRRRRDAELAKAAYLAAARQYIITRPADSVARLGVTPAVAPAPAVPRRTLQSVVIGLSIGFLMSVLIVLVSTPWSAAADRP